MRKSYIPFIKLLEYIFDIWGILQTHITHLEKSTKQFVTMCRENKNVIK
jgi:hypothetical protein